MRRVPGGRHCDRCDKRVVDFTAMTEREALIVASLFAPGSLCGRLPNVRNGVPRFREETRVRSSRSFVPTMLVTAAMAAGCSAPLAVATADPAAQSAKTAAKSPTADSDGDGIPDNKDQCPADPEDRDGFQDEDGCPDPDNDKDGILDAKDQCPNEPETYNGLNDDDGCPDKGGVIIVDAPVGILEVIIFDANSDAVPAAANPILDALAKTFKANPQLGTIVVKGHSLSTEKDAAKLAGRRATQVLDALAKRGVDKANLTTRAMPPEAPPKDEPARSRRVDFELATTASCPKP
jgi:outer membrane protein OmpA-like peptidoglycan-associated protein